jgi:hypothetical protein
MIWYTGFSQSKADQSAGLSMFQIISLDIKDSRQWIGVNEINRALIKIGLYFFDGY